jgi:hypothetical protein
MVRECLILTKDTELKPLQNMDEDALKMYFDTEINHILDKIKGIKTEKPEEPYRETLNSGDENEVNLGDIDKIKEEMISAGGSGREGGKGIN